jgi:nucleoside-diphosphate-sugar epimerase
VGTALATQLAAAGANVVVVTRSGSGPDVAGVTRKALDVADTAALRAAVPEAAVIYNCVNPPYHRWVEDWPPMAESFLAYAEATGAVLVTCSNLYGYGPVTVPMTEDLPLAATGTKAKVRVAMWREALARHEAGRIKATEVRGSDYIAASDQSMLGERVVPRVLARKSVQLLGDVDAPHTWTSPIDVARLMVIAGSDERAWGKVWHVPSNPPRSSREAVADISRAAGVNSVKVSALPNIALSAVGLFNPQIRELKETSYQRERPYILDDSAARETFGIEPTPWDDILTQLVASYRTAS